MKSTYRFFLLDQDFSQRELVITNADLLHQMTKVLRLRPTDEIALLDNTGMEYTVRLTKIEKRQATAYVLARQACETENEIQIHLYQSLLKNKDRFELVLQKGTELGVTRFIPLRTEYCEFKGKVNQERSFAILKEAAEQSGRGKIPDLFGERKFTDALHEAEGEKILFDPLGISFKNYRLQAKTCSLFIGPEGGVTEKELALAEQAGAKMVSLGKRLLRSETAGIVGTSLLNYLI